VRELAAEHGVGLLDSHMVFACKVRSGALLASLMSSGNHPNRKGPNWGGRLAQMVPVIAGNTLETGAYRSS
jgi:lysophospholipase L1-like esterase